MVVLVSTKLQFHTGDKLIMVFFIRNGALDKVELGTIVFRIVDTNILCRLNRGEMKRNLGLIREIAFRSGNLNDFVVANVGFLQHSPPVFAGRQFLNHSRTSNTYNCPRNLHALVVAVNHFNNNRSIRHKRIEGCAHRLHQVADFSTLQLLAQTAVFRQRFAQRKNFLALCCTFSGFFIARFIRHPRCFFPFGGRILLFIVYFLLIVFGILLFR